MDQGQHAGDRAKWIRAEGLERMPPTRFIASNAAEGGLWHVGKRAELRGGRTGLLLAVYYVTACSGKRLGGPWGQAERDDRPEGPICPRCARIAARVALAGG